MMRTFACFVAHTITDPRFLDGSHCIEFIHAPARYVETGDAYCIKQIACCVQRQDPKELPFIVERHRGFKAKLTDPWPTWRAFFGSGIGPNGFYGSCAMHLQELISPGELRLLAEDDRVPPEEPKYNGWRYEHDRFANERKPRSPRP